MVQNKTQCYPITECSNKQKQICIFVKNAFSFTRKNQDKIPYSLFFKNMLNDGEIVYFFKENVYN